jgi:leucyl aminopeptidase
LIWNTRFTSAVSSGGYNIKAVPVATIELMKKDMGGAAAVFGAAEVLGQIKPPGVEVLGGIQLLVSTSTNQ